MLLTRPSCNHFCEIISVYTCLETTTVDLFVCLLCTHLASLSCMLSACNASHAVFLYYISSKIIRWDTEGSTYVQNDGGDVLSNSWHQQSLLKA